MMYYSVDRTLDKATSVTMETYSLKNFNMCFYEDGIQNSQYSTHYNCDNTYFEPTVQTVAAPHHMTVATMMRGYNIAASTEVKKKSEPRYGQFRHSKSKRARTTFNNIQILALEKEFRCSPYITRASRLELAVRIHLPELQIKIWFQNRRMKAKKESERVRRDSGNSSSSTSDTPLSPQIGNVNEDQQKNQEYHNDFDYKQIRSELNYNCDEYWNNQYSSMINLESMTQATHFGEEYEDLSMYDMNSPTPENSASENSSFENSASKNSPFENFASVNSASENSVCENSASENSSSENSASENSASEDDFFKICGEELINWILENSTGYNFE